MNVSDAYMAAVAADDAWQAALDAQKVDRWSIGAIGAKGSALRALYDAKVSADKAAHDAWESSRAKVAS